MHHISQFFLYKNYCHANRPELDATKCAIAYAFYKRHDDFNQLASAKRIIGEFKSRDQGTKLIWQMRNSSKNLIHVGLFFYALGIKFNKRLLMLIIFMLNVYQHMPTLYSYFERVGIDTTAYVNQAGQFISGQLEFDKISSAQG